MNSKFSICFFSIYFFVNFVFPTFVSNVFVTGTGNARPQPVNHKQRSNRKSQPVNYVPAKKKQNKKAKNGTKNTNETISNGVVEHVIQDKNGSSNHDNDKNDNKNNDQNQIGVQNMNYLQFLRREENKQATEILQNNVNMQSSSMQSSSNVRTQDDKMKSEVSDELLQKQITESFMDESQFPSLSNLSLYDGRQLHYGRQLREKQIMQAQNNMQKQQIQEVKQVIFSKQKNQALFDVFCFPFCLFAKMFCRCLRQHQLRYRLRASYKKRCNKSDKRKTSLTSRVLQM